MLRAGPDLHAGHEDLIGELKASYTIVIVTHNKQQAARISDRTAVFNLAGDGQPGRLVEYDDTRTIFSTPRERPPRTTSPGASADQPSDDGHQARADLGVTPLSTTATQD